MCIRTMYVGIIYTMYMCMCTCTHVHVHAIVHVHVHAIVHVKSVYNTLEEGRERRIGIHVHVLVIYMCKLYHILYMYNLCHRFVGNT